MHGSGPYLVWIGMLVIVGSGVAQPVTAPGVSPQGVDTASGPSKTISGCTTVSESGTYRLTRDIVDADLGRNFTFSSEACIRIEASDVHLDGDGHTVNGFGVTDTTAVRVASSRELENVTVTDLTITEWNRAIYVRNASNVTISDVNSTGNTFGFYLENTWKVTVRDSTASTGFIGVYLHNARCTSLTNMMFESNHADDVVREGESRCSPTTAPTRPPGPQPSLPVLDGLGPLGPLLSLFPVEL
ncbi:right-handed parallel beta-helix repeat-containing protein [Halorussus salinisoli]|uniref:right-handed parallel beta-helix repeat-containing protein n=1 Tax=Halorussus salinisoli TaxID=2558242 RepID=UPI0010C188DF|nr:right-handed parallel beta-helix repeat-containing protein [Halorussus salinisoli]